ncbi:MAG: methyltransferase domain-containing protein [Woeseia sp.]|nr:methyltransferase domain-containing protein [Woeseia sp.]
MTDESCPNCHAEFMAVIYEVRRVPVQSCQLISDAARAQRYPCGDLRLAHCANCGFISNLLFNKALQEYCPPTHETHETHQTTSNLNGYAEAIVDSWIREYQIRDKTIVEIGCAEDDMLPLLSSLGGNSGICVDVSCEPTQSTDSVKGTIDKIRQEFSTRYGNCAVDVICSGNALQYVYSTAKFLKALRRDIGNDPNTLLLFVVPDAQRILETQAFWEFNYDHCSYFTAGSLAHVFRRNAFDVVDLERCYEDNFLVLAARPSAEATPPTLAIENDRPRTRRELGSFTVSCAETVRFWRDRLSQLSAQQKKIVVWGPVSKCVSFFTTLGIRNEVDFAVNSDPQAAGKYLPGTGHEIRGPEDLRKTPPDVVIALDSRDRKEIVDRLNVLGIKPEMLSL